VAVGAYEGRVEPRGRWRTSGRCNILWIDGSVVVIVVDGLRSAAESGD
jgi:prepilin-type processing-associated H-X9-DG protein